jgi:tetrahydromethanopterin S-methyltransferase subunit B
MLLELSDEERELVVEILTGRLTEMRGEVYHADVSSYKDKLKASEVMVKDLLARLDVEPGA